MNPGRIQAALFWRFCTVGALGFAVDITVLYVAHALGLNLFAARGVSFLAAASFTWWGNRQYTFAADARSDPLFPEWLRYLLSMALGGCANYSAYALLIAWCSLFEAQPWMAVAVGTAVGLTINYLLARRILAVDKDA